MNIVDDDGFIPLKMDPKVTLARMNSELFPLDVNIASYSELMRVPGIGHTSAIRILKLQQQGIKLTKSQQLKSIGIVLKRALPFIKVGTRTQLTLDAFKISRGGV